MPKIAHNAPWQCSIYWNIWTLYSIGKIIINIIEMKKHGSNANNSQMTIPKKNIFAMYAMWTSVITIEIAKTNLKWRRRCRESKLTLSVWSASGGQSSPFGMRGQPTIQYVLYCFVLYTIQCEANQRAPTRHYDPSGCPLHCACAAMVCSATFLSCHLTRAVCSIMSMIFFSDLVIGRTILFIHAIRVLAESRVASFNLRVESWRPH